MLDVRRLPSAVVAATFALSGVVAGTGVTSVALGVGSGDGPICPGVEEERPARGILDCLGPSTAYVQTPYGSGSGLVLPDGYVLTNAHVVDPFPVVDLTIGEEEHTDVPVKGVDLFADIAVLGPIETEAPAVTLVDPAELLEGDKLFLVGYPGEANDEDLEPTIADGILSRTRHSKTFGLDYLQTDASIGGGQSGGALVNLEGGVVGISSLRFAENFALALSGADAQSSVTKILAGDGSPYQAWPGAEPVPSTSLHLTEDFNPEFVSVPAAPEERTIDVTVPADLPLILVTVSLEQDEAIQGAANYRAIVAEELDVPIDHLAGVSDAELQEATEEEAEGETAPTVAPGVFRFTLPAGEHVMIGVMTNRESAMDVPVSATLPVAPLVAEGPTKVELGHASDGTVGSLVPYDRFEIDLAAGQEIEIAASSPSGDMRVVVRAPSGEEDEFDDSKVGLYGVDVEETYTAEEDGTFTVEVGQVSEHATGYHFEIRTPA
ncbi:MAG TPA: serine protease [Acidimicrobiales bacterium]|nr:serine protease [Acidimicrobiales bacterium]